MKKYLIKLTRIAVWTSKKIFYNVVSDWRSHDNKILRFQRWSKVKITADKQGIDLVGASCEFYGSEINSEYSNQNLNNNEHIIGKNERKRPAEEASSIMRSQIRITSGTEIEETDSNMTYSDEEPSETFLSQQSYTNTTKVNSSLALAKEVEKEKK
ncbi:unnamed protein product [Rhizophagus irregularis]|nr:unnamed protein product [Rhizophagus irregularis]